MKVLIGILVVVAVLVILVFVGRRIEKEQLALEAQRRTDQHRNPHSPLLLSKAQRKALNFKDRHPPKKDPRPSVIRPAANPLPKVTRAISTGWSIGEVEFSYEDAVGEITYRTVTVHSVTRTYIKGECHTRRQERTFRIDRIIGDLIDCDTGEILSPKEWARQNS